MSRNAIFVAAIGGVVMLAVIVFVMLRLASAPEETHQASPEPRAAPSSPPSQDTPQVQISDEALTGPTVYYTKTGFFPPEVSVKVASGGCIVQIINQTSESLTLRLSPYDPKGVTGPQYEPVPTGGAILIDPRFRVPEIAFHDRVHPDKEFSVTLGTGCKLE